MELLNDCGICKHFDHEKSERTQTAGIFYCAAFPDGEGTPDAIMQEEHAHRTPYPGDHGIQFAEQVYGDEE